jgi:hypothetical protein
MGSGGKTTRELPKADSGLATNAMSHIQEILLVTATPVTPVTSRVSRICRVAGRFTISHAIVGSEFGGDSEGAVATRRRRTLTMASIVTLNTTRASTERRLRREEEFLPSATVADRIGGNNLLALLKEE